MVFHKNFVVAVKVDGKYLRDDDSIVQLPFQSEYSLYLKNMENRRAIAKVSIDGQDVLGGKWLVIDSNSSVDLDGFIKDNIVRNKFKFIERTKNIEDHRGIHPEDSLIRAEIVFENLIHYKTSYTYFPYYPHYPYPNITWTSNVAPAHSATNNTVSLYCSNVDTSMAYKNTGITVEGNEVNRPVANGYVGSLENESHVIVLKLVGENVETIRTTREKIECATCGKSNRSDSKFCSECGTYLK
jgi:hypothetical protein